MLAVKNLACLRGERCLFSDLSFQLSKGGLMHLVGSNGIGKSSLLRLLAGFSYPLAGQVLWDGNAIEDDVAGYRQNLVFLQDQAPLKKQLSPRNHLKFWRDLLTFEDGDPNQLGLTEVADIPSRWLSYGQKRRSSFQLLSETRPLWLLDEPFVGLDHQGVEMLLTKIDHHRQKDGMIILTSHIRLDIVDAITLNLADFSANTAVNS